jgi:hypothetical protein
VTHPKYDAELLPLPANTSAVVKGVLPPTTKAMIAAMVESYLGMPTGAVAVHPARASSTTTLRASTT